MERLAENPQLRRDFKAVLNLTNILSSIPARQGLRILHGSAGKELGQQSRLEEEIELVNMTKCLEDKLPNKIAGESRELTRIFACKIIEAVGPTFAQQLVSIISKIDGHEELDCLI